MINISSLLVFAGRLHIVLLHMPIGIIGCLAAVEVFYKLRRRALDRSVRVLIAWLAAAACVVTVATGLLLSREPEYGGSTLDLHKWLGIATGSVMLLAALAALRWVRVYWVLLAAATILVVPTGHLGGSMVHGSDFLWAPFQPARRAGTGNGSNGGGAPVPKAPPDPVFESRVLPIFQARCMPCHSDAKHKGGLSLASLDAVLAGGEDGPVLDAGEPEKSDLLYRLRVEPSDEDHMPPKSKPQLTAEETSKIDEWVKSRAAKGPGAGPAPKESPAAPAPEKPAAPGSEKPKKETLAEPPPAAIEALRAQLVHVETIDPAENLLWIDFGAAPKTDDALAARLLTPLSAWVRDLSVAGTKTGDETVKLAAGMPRLRALNLSGTRVSGAGLEALKGAKGLEELTLTRTKLDDGAAGAIAAAPGLKRVFVWKSGIAGAGVEALRKARPELVVETGDVETHAAVETEPPIALSSNEPPPGAATPAAASLEPVNDVCPVSGKPVNAKFAVVYEGKVIGFCCEKCAAQFWAAPEKFAVKAK